MYGHIWFSYGFFANNGSAMKREPAIFFFFSGLC